MRNLFRFILKHHFILLFILFESLSFYLIVKYNTNQNQQFIKSSNVISGIIYDSYSSFTEYLSLKDANRQLATENAALSNILKSSYKSNKVSFELVRDSIYLQNYVYTEARVINNSVNKKYNHLTLNKGRNQGVDEGMAVLGPAGVVGVVSSVSDNFASVISILNRNLMISSKLKKNDYFGSVIWDEKDYKKAILNDIPTHVKINRGDTVVTSGYSSLFPAGKMIGIVSEVENKKGSSFYEITVNLSTDFKNLSYVYVVGNLLKNEQKELENENKDV